MRRRFDIVSPKYILRDMVFKHGGVMPIAEILRTREFKYSDADLIRRLAYDLRKDHKAKDFGYGVEAWEVLDKRVIGLETCLTQGMRRRIQLRRHDKERGVAEQTMLDNLMFQGKIQHNGVVHKEAIIRRLQVSTKALRQAAASSSSVRDTLEEHGEDFGNAAP